MLYIRQNNGQVIVSSNDLGPIVGILAIVLMIISILAVFIRVTTKFVRARSLDSEEYLILLAVVRSL